MCRDAISYKTSRPESVRLVYIDNTLVNHRANLRSDILRIIVKYTG